MSPSIDGGVDEEVVGVLTVVVSGRGGSPASDNGTHLGKGKWGTDGVRAREGGFEFG